MAEEKVTAIDWHPKWDGGAPMPQVFSNGHKVFLIYLVAYWEEHSLVEINTKRSVNGGELLALVEFEGHTFRFGIANDEVFPGLPLYEDGLHEWAHIIENSSWIEEIKKIHQIHPYFNNDSWTSRNHYVLLFKDDILEVIATSYKIEVFKSNFYEIGLEVLDRLNQ